MKILALDDEPIILNVIREMLSGSFDVDCVSTPMQALELLETMKYDVVLTDYSMPVMDGLVFARKAKILQPGLRIFLVTGTNIDSADTNSAIVSAVIHKPIKWAELLAILATCESQLNSTKG